MPTKQNVIVLMMVMEAVFHWNVVGGSFTLLKLLCRAMNYGSIDRRKVERQKKPLQELTNQMERYIHHLQYLHWPTHSTGWSGLWPERETE